MKKNSYLFIVMGLLFLTFLINKNTINFNKIDGIKNIILNFQSKIILKTKINYSKSNENIIRDKDNEINELNKILGIKNIYDFEIINCHVIKRDFNSFTGNITIDKGKKDGIVTDSAVINSDGLIGIIDKVYHDTSLVKLITNDLNISVKVKDTDYNAIIDGYDYANNLIKATLIRSNSSVIKGEHIYTNGLGKKMIGGIKVGEIADIIDNTNLATRELRIKSFVDFDNINYVSVIVK